MALKRKAHTFTPLRMTKRTKPTPRTYYRSAQTVKADGRREVKTDTGTISSSMSSSGTVTLITSIQNGSDANQRLGRTINNHSFKAKFSLQLGTGATYGSLTTLALVYDKQSNGAAPAWTDVFGAANANALPNPNNVNRFEILWQKNYTQTLNTTLGTVQNPAYMDTITVDLKGKKTHFKGTTSAVTDIESGAIFLMHLSSVGATNYLDMFEQLNYFE